MEHEHRGPSELRGSLEPTLDALHQIDPPPLEGSVARETLLYLPAPAQRADGAHGVGRRGSDVRLVVLWVTSEAGDQIEATREEPRLDGAVDYFGLAAVLSDHAAEELEPRTYLRRPVPLETRDSFLLP